MIVLSTKRPIPAKAPPGLDVACLLLATALLGAQSVDALRAGEPSARVEPEVEWVRSHSHKDWTESHPSLVRDVDGGVYAVGIGNRLRAGEQLDCTLWVWKLDAAGKRVWARTLEVPGLPDGEDILLTRCFSMEDERIALVQESLPRTGAWLLRFDTSGAVTSSRAILERRGLQTIWSFKRVGDGFLIAGRESRNDGDGWILKIDAEGTEQWQRAYDHGHQESITALDAREDGSFVFAANSGTYDKFGAGPSRVWVVSCNAEGEILRQATFEGRQASLARSSDGTCAVAINTGDFPRARMEIRGLDAHLDPTWGPLLLSSGMGLGLYPVATSDRDDFLVAGASSGRVYLWKIGKTGSLAWKLPIRTSVRPVVLESLLLDKETCMFAAAGRDSEADRSAEDVSSEAPAYRDHSDVVVGKVRMPVTRLRSRRL